MADKRDNQTTTQPQLQPKTSLSALRKALPYVVAVVLFWGLSALYFAPQYSGEVLVMHDMLGLTNNFSPKFLRRYANLHDECLKAFSQYVDDVKNHDFPNDKEQY